MNFLFPVLASVLFGSVAAALVAHFLTTFRADLEYRLRKLEELYVALEASVRHVRVIYHDMSNVALGALSWKDAVAKGDRLMSDFQRDHSTATMIASIYFPDLVYVVERIRDFVEEFHTETIDPFTAVHVDGVKLPPFQRQFKTARADLRKRMQEACEKVVETSNDLRRGWFRTFLRSATSW
jgi:hypothetical protein